MGSDTRKRPGRRGDMLESTREGVTDVCTGGAGAQAGMYAHTRYDYVSYRAGVYAGRDAGTAERPEDVMKIKSIDTK